MNSRSVSAVTFILHPTISFSISVPKKYAEKIEHNSFLVNDARNMKMDLSKIIIDIIFRELKVKNYQEFNKLKGMPEIIDKFRDVFYNNLSKGRHGFSSWLLDEILKEMDKKKK